MPKTSVVNKHSHEYSNNRVFTSTDNNHKHRINIKSGIAEMAHGHTHRLLGLKSNEMMGKHKKKKKLY